MELDLKELGLTFLAGAFVILAVEALCYYTFNFQVTGFFAGEWGLRRDPQAKDGGNPTQLPVVIVFCFCIGLLTEDVCYKFADTIAFPAYRTLRLPLTRFVDELKYEDGHVSRNVLQVVAIVKGLRSRDYCLKREPLPPCEAVVRVYKNNQQAVWRCRTTGIEITGLGYELANRHAFARIDGQRGADVEAWIVDGSVATSSWYSRLDASRLPAARREGVRQLPSRCDGAPQTLTREDVEDSIRRVWYHAKNRVYANEQYYEEIDRMQSRLDFSRTLSAVARSLPTSPCWQSSLPQSSASRRSSRRRSS